MEEGMDMDLNGEDIGDLGEINDMDMSFGEMGGDPMGDMELGEEIYGIDEETK